MDIGTELFSTFGSIIMSCTFGYEINKEKVEYFENGKKKESDLTSLL